MGWNTIHIQVQHPLLKDIENEEFFYFVHSYYAPQTSHTVASCNYISIFQQLYQRIISMVCNFIPKNQGNQEQKF